MEAEKKIKKYNFEEKQKIINDFYKDRESLSLDFKINEKPIPYARARAGRHGFYNPKSKDEKRYKNLFLHQIKEEDWNVLKELLNNEDSLYYVSISGTFYVPIPQSDSAKTATLKESKIILPSIRNGDIDNYMKFILDSLHDVIYTDDKCVISIDAKKYYSINPRSEIHIDLDIIHR